MLRTYDVFDTVITRLVGDPRSVFLLLGQRLVVDGLWKGLAEQFAASRVDAEARARRFAAPEEVTLVAIYRELMHAHAMPEQFVGQFCERELQLERRLLRAVPHHHREMAAFRESGDTIAFISDMYLPAESLRVWLSELQVMGDADRLWVSSESGATKASGRLYELVREAHAPSPMRWLHAGDNWWSDVDVPARQRIAIRHDTACHLNADEQMLETASVASCGLASMLAGAARWTRVSRPAGSDPELHRLAADVGGPVLYAFVLWVLLEARRNGLRRLWFMARDGEVMLPIARTIAARLGLELELGYLYGGRQVVRLASLTSIDASALDWITGGAGEMTIQAVLDRVGVDLARVRHVAVELGLPIEQRLGWDCMPRLRRLLTHPEVAALILAEAAARRRVVLDYFASCGLLGDEACAVVDIGWRGNVLRAIVDLIGIEQAARHTFLYFGLYAHPKACAAVPMRAYLFDLDGEVQFGTGADLASLTTLMEIFCQADHGQVMHIERRGAGFVPVCRPPSSEEAQTRWNVPAFQAAVSGFAESVPIEELPVVNADMRSVCAALLRRLLELPTAEEVDLLAPIAFVDDQGGSAAQRFASSYGLSDLRNAFRSGVPWPSLGLNWWVAGAIQLTPAPVQWLMRAAAKAGRLRRRWQTEPA